MIMHTRQLCLTFLLHVLTFPFSLRLVAVRGQEERVQPRYEDSCSNGSDTETCNENRGTRTCLDHDSACADWALQDKCALNAPFMLMTCPKSCFMCDSRQGNKQWNPWGEPQTIPRDEAQSTLVLDHLDKVSAYMTETVYVDPYYESVRSSCKNLNEKCTMKAVSGSCEQEPLYMNVVCAPSCLACHNCAFTSTTPPSIWTQPGDIDRTFSRIVLDPAHQVYKPLVHFRPKVLDHLDSDDARQKLLASGKEGPWLITLEEFLTVEETDTLIALADNQTWSASRLSSHNDRQGRLANTHRNSTNTWCTGACASHPISQGITNKLTSLLGIPPEHSEDWQMVRYEPTEFYGVHHDFSVPQINRVEGVRILTVFFYLNDVEEGGETHFPRLNLTVTPARGKVVIWTNVLEDNNATVQDDRTFHQALPVIRGIKYGGNAWYHQRDYKGPFARGCLAVYKK